MAQILLLFSKLRSNGQLSQSMTSSFSMFVSISHKKIINGYWYWIHWHGKTKEKIESLNESGNIKKMLKVISLLSDIFFDYEGIFSSDFIDIDWIWNSFIDCHGWAWAILEWIFLLKNRRKEVTFEFDFCSKKWYFWY